MFTQGVTKINLNKKTALLVAQVAVYGAFREAQNGQNKGCNRTILGARGAAHYAVTEIWYSLPCEVQDQFSLKDVKDSVRREKLKEKKAEGSVVTGCEIFFACVWDIYEESYRGY